MKRSLALAVLALAFAPGARADVSPGDVITAANKEKVRGLIPDEFYTYAIQNFPDLNMKIVESKDYPVHPKYVEATAQFACQAHIDADGKLVNYTAGQPFPYSEWAKEATHHKCDLTPDDPQFSLKLAWDVNFRWQGGSGLNLPHWGFANLRNNGREEWRLSQGEYRRTYFSARADLLPETTELEKGTNVEWAEFFDVKSPFDLRGTMFLLYRYRDNKADDTWAYIPALRRVRRIAATQKSDSLLGTEFTLEDFYLFSGYVWDHNWEYKGEKPMLAIPDSGRTCFPKDSGETEARGMARLGTEQEWHECRFDPYGVLPMVGESWQKREAFEPQEDLVRQGDHGARPRRRLRPRREAVQDPRPGGPLERDQRHRREQGPRRDARQRRDDREPAEHQLEPGPVRRRERDGVLGRREQALLRHHQAEGGRALVLAPTGARAASRRRLRSAAPRCAPFRACCRLCSCPWKSARARSR